MCACVNAVAILYNIGGGEFEEEEKGLGDNQICGIGAGLFASPIPRGHATNTNKSFKNECTGRDRGFWTGKKKKEKKKSPKRHLLNAAAAADVDEMP